MTETPSRRAVMKAAVWSVPVIAAAVAVPTASASDGWEVWVGRVEYTRGGSNPTICVTNSSVMHFGGPVATTQVFTIRTNTGDVDEWRFPKGEDYSTFGSCFIPGSLDATELYVITPGGEEEGPFSIDRSALG